MVCGICLEFLVEIGNILNVGKVCAIHIYSLLKYESVINRIKISEILDAMRVNSSRLSFVEK